MTDTILYDYWRSSASYRVRIALNLARIDYRAVSVDLVAGGQNAPEHLAMNPQGFVPVLQIDGHRFTQSLAILDYLNDTRALNLLPSDPVQAAKVRALAHAVAVDIHPVCNLQVVAHVAGLVPDAATARADWMARFIAPGLTAFDEMLKGFDQAPYATGAEVSLADICLMPQLYNALRWGVDYAECNRIIRVQTACERHSAFAAAHPDQVKPL